MAPRVFPITGTSTGFGKEFVKVVLKNGDHVVATARNSSKLSFDDANDSNSLFVDLDVTQKDSIDTAFDAAIKKFKRVDVVVNNAGYGLSGPFETLSERQIRQQMEINFFGVLDVTRKAVETMRELKTGGVIQQLTSIGSQWGAPNFSIYCASKWAVEGFTEALSQEVKPEWGIKFTCIEPGGFRTESSGQNMEFGEVEHSAYDDVDAKKKAEGRYHAQPGDPAKAAKVFYDLAIMEEPPLRCVVGGDALAVMNKKLETYSQNVKKYKDFSKNTGFDKSEA